MSQAWKVHGIALLTLASCSDTARTPRASAFLPNRCNSTADCAAMVAGSICDHDTASCRVFDPLPLSTPITWIVTFPLSSGAARGVEGQTLAWQRSKLLCPTAKKFCATQGACCPPAGSIALSTNVGWYETDGQTAADVGFQLPVGGAAIPVQARFRPLSPFENSTDFASFARVSLTPVLADRFVGIPRLKGPAPGVPSEGFTVRLPDNRYLRVLEPIPPFDEHFPPVVDTFDVATNDVVARIKDLSVKKWNDPKQFTLDTLQPLEGWQLYFRDLQNGERVSSIFKPRTGHNEVTLYTIGYSDLANVNQRVEIVIEPPPTSRFVPTYRSEVVVSPGPQEMPLLPPPKHFAGVTKGHLDSVNSADWPFVRATVRFKSAIGDHDESLLEPTEKDSRLHYTTEVATDDGGNFDVMLPPGSYDVLVLPALDSGFGAKAFRRRQFGSSSLGFGASFTAPPLGRLQGVVTVPNGIPNGAPLVGATVRARPSFSRSPDTGPFGVFARTRTALTESDGSFSIAVDAGTYDIVVEPPPSSHWPATIVLGKTVPEAGDDVGAAPRAVEPVRLDPIRLAAPLDLGFTLTEFGGQTRPVAGALVRVYTLLDGNIPIELGSALSDENGRVDLFATMPVAAH